MNLGLISSYVVGGMVLLGILAMTMNLNSSSSELTISQMKKEHLNTVSELFSNDIPKIGYNRTSLTDTLIFKADSTELVFDSNIDNSTDGKVERISWSLTNTSVNTSPNPNDFILLRKIREKGNTLEKKTPIPFGVTYLRFRYYDEYGSDNPLPTPVSAAKIGDIKQIEVEIVIQSPNKITYPGSNEGRYVSTSWRKRFSPVNLREN
ncbi:MAG: hypothetical protein R3281_18735 [Balneolaceae bacterium]|nr:hypothetical protein [Balneolaceae bacterium]